MTTQYDLFGEPIAEPRQKKAKAQQGELFQARDLAQFGVKANPKMKLSPGRLALQIQDTRTADEVERERMEDAQALTAPLPEQPAPLTPYAVYVAALPTLPLLPATTPQPAPIATGLLRGFPGQPGTPVDILRQIRPGLYTIRSATGKTADVWEHELIINPPAPQPAAVQSTAESSLPPCAICQGETVGPVAERGVCDSCLEKIQAYSDRVQARIERLRDYAEKVEREGRAEHDRAHQMAEVIPFGQPILIGHHSERRDRNYRERIHNTFGRAFAKLERAAELERRADRAEANGAISSDDPAAVLKLQDKLAKLQEFQEQAKRINKAVRAVLKQSDDKAAQIDLLMKAAGIQYKTAENALTPDYLGRYGVPDYALSNNNGNMRRIRERIADLQKKAALAESPDLVREEQHGAIRLERDPEENRLRLHFPGKPAPAVISELKSRGFRWSPTNKAWQRQLSNGAEYAAECVIALVQKGQ